MASCALLIDALLLGREEHAVNAPLTHVGALRQREEEDAMRGLLRHPSLGRLPVVLGLVLMGLVFAPSAWGAAQLDTATATGSGGYWSNINISAQSGTSGQNPSGTASFTAFAGLNVSGPVTCLSVTGADHGSGTVGSPTTAVMNVQDPTIGGVTV